MKYWKTTVLWQPTANDNNRRPIQCCQPLDRMKNGHVSVTEQYFSPFCVLQQSKCKPNQLIKIDFIECSHNLEMNPQSKQLVFDCSVIIPPPLRFWPNDIFWRPTKWHISTPDQMTYFDARPNDLFRRPTKCHISTPNQITIFWHLTKWHISTPDQMTFWVNQKKTFSRQKIQFEFHM